eukprot:2937415-Lingulodinium_polyedra.AAC.1
MVRTAPSTPHPLAHLAEVDLVVLLGRPRVEVWGPTRLVIRREARRIRVLKRSAPFPPRAALPEVWRASPRVARSAEGV